MKPSSNRSRPTLTRLFKDAEQYVIPNQFTEIAEANGAVGVNASTSLDTTQYFWSMPANRFELWAYMESDRIANPVPREFYKERDVVMEERRMRVDSSPIGKLVEQFLAAAYVAHPYHRPNVGWESELSQISATEAAAFHAKYYVPSNIVVAVAGDLKAADVMPVLEKYFGRIPAGPPPEAMATVEPPQVAEKTVLLKQPTQPIYIEGYHKPDYRDPDDAAYDAITDIFSNGRTSRLYRSLVRDQQIAAQVEGFSGFPGDKYPGLFVFFTVPLPGHTPEQMRDAIHKEIDKLKTADVTDDELQMFKTRSRADLLRGLGDNEGLATQLAEYQQRYGDWRELFRQLDKIDKVSKADIRRVANKTFVDTNRTIGILQFEQPKGAPPPEAAAGNGGARMKKTFLSCLGLFATVLAASSALAQSPAAPTTPQAQPWKSIPIPPLAAFHPQTAESGLCSRTASSSLSPKIMNSRSSTALSR